MTRAGIINYCSDYQDPGLQAKNIYYRSQCHVRVAVLTMSLAWDDTSLSCQADVWDKIREYVTNTTVSGQAGAQDELQRRLLRSGPSSSPAVGVLDLSSPYPAAAALCNASNLTRHDVCTALGSTCEAWVLLCTIIKQVITNIILNNVPPVVQN